MVIDDLTYGKDGDMYWAGNVLKLSGENKRINDFWKNPKVRMYTVTYPDSYIVRYTGNRGTYLNKPLFALFCDWLSYEASKLCKGLMGASYMMDTRAYFRDLKGNVFGGIEQQ